MRVAARHLQTQFLNTMTGLAAQERQKIKISSTGMEKTILCCDNIYAIRGPIVENISCGYKNTL